MLKSTSIELFIILAGVFLAFAHCADKDPLPTQQDKIEGFWIGGAWNHETNRYYFHDGAAWADKYSNGVFQGREDYAYFFDADTLRLMDVSTLARFDYVASFPTDTTARLGAVNGLVLNLVRIK